MESGVVRDGCRNGHLCLGRRACGPVDSPAGRVPLPLPQPRCLGRQCGPLAHRLCAAGRQPQSGQPGLLRGGLRRPPPCPHRAVFHHALVAFPVGSGDVHAGQHGDPPPQHECVPGRQCDVWPQGAQRGNRSDRRLPQSLLQHLRCPVRGLPDPVLCAGGGQWGCAQRVCVLRSGQRHGGHVRGQPV